MKYFFTSLVTLIAAILVTAVYLPLGFAYSLGHAVYMSFKSDKYRLLKLLWRIINGFFAAVGYILFHLAVGLDMFWNVFGELIEDFFTHEEQTHYGEPLITVSSSTGDIQKRGRITKLGLGFSKLLNKVFGQKQHCLDSWELHNKSKELRKKYFN